MRTRTRKALEFLGALVLVLGLVWAIWGPVLPSAWVVGKMADAINPEKVQLELPVTVRFVLSGKGGGTISIVVDRDGVETVKGETDRADLILCMAASDFNALMFALARGDADQYTFQSLIISKDLRFAGDIGLLEKLLPPKAEAAPK